MAATPRQVLGLYKQLLREGERFANYNYRSYAIRRVKDYFKDKRGLTDPAAISKEYQYGVKSLALIQRQVAVSHMYSHANAKQVVE
ncbi:PREDICTED: LYR motif-containing protein 4B-like [Amphimedon queenslandica]|uniref:Complex 1 LYR protein domain-containing protein n=1 Tax=Amphimedon queenslandica TaxID=400682 RepID=A0A1X7VAY5_AMPQE|nr:PREDICTED: LYR motif-containing protein 4B-like [Amphimedon queenslandica]|eukprot:XP_003385066.1 PREDICTED: LYR motif-containing protein 4B-like [Amphimedon queenslandica]